MYDEILPYSKNLDIASLSRCFKNVVNSYKFYWFLSILDFILDSDELTIGYKELAVRMLTTVWYPLDYFKLSFGAHDGFKVLALEVSKHMTVDNHLSAESLRKQMEKKLPDEIFNNLNKVIEAGLMRWVCFRFLSPFVESHVRGLADHKVNRTIASLSRDDQYKRILPYQINANSITLNPIWREYFLANQSILRGFIRWHLVKFLQKNNSNIIGLTEKLDKPTTRDLSLAKKFWSTYSASNAINCIYSNNNLNGQELSLDHFIPWSYIAHDQLWNIVPTTKTINSMKSDHLPDLRLYLDAFCTIQYNAFVFHLNCSHINFLEDYIRMLGLNKPEFVGNQYFINRLRAEIENHSRMASQLGFPAHFVFSSEV